MAGCAPVCPYQVAAYYFPNYHVDPRNEAALGKGWTEWELVRAARPRFEGHVQPKVPAWGHGDEADPRVFERKIDAAADHGIDAFIFDWYWYDDGPFLNRALDEGYLQARNSNRLKFALMWANHDWVDIFPARLSGKRRLLYPGAVTRKTFDAMTDRIVRDYFAHPSCWKLEGKPYFSIYDWQTFVKGLGGAAAAREALEGFRGKTRKAGFPGLHLNVIDWGLKDRSDAATFGIDSVTSYVWVHCASLPRFPATDYPDVLRQVEGYWEKAFREFRTPYFPNVTMGWDSSPRTKQDGPFRNAGYPYMPVFGGNTPEAFRNALLKARDFMGRGGAKVLTLNAWNEWTEGSYLEPDTVNGPGYLEAIRDVFPP